MNRARNKFLPVFFGAFFASVLLSCVSRDFDESLPKKKDVKATASASSGGRSEQSPSGVCPDGTRFNSFPRVCVTRGGFALGPFPLELQELCRQMSPDDSSTCVQKQDWPFELLMSLVSSYKLGCPPGTSPGQDGVCIGPDNIYGPFTLQQIMACRASVPAVQQKQCDEIVWPPDFLKFANEPASEKKNSDAPKEPQVVQTPPPVSPVDKEVASKPPLETETAKKLVVKDETKDETKDEVKKKLPEGAAAQETQAKPLPQQPQEETPKAPTFCVYSWDEKPGTADLTTINRKLGSLLQPQSYPLDREEGSSLLGSSDFQSLDMCGRARFLKGCFQRVIFDNNSPSAQTFRTWALGRVRPLEAHMAFVMSQTRLGLWHDECWRGRCNGIGLSKVTSARTVTGKRYAKEDVVWRGITHNIVTNLRFGLRQLSAKAALGPSDLYQLAYSFNGVPGRQEQFAQQVDKFYRQLVACQLD